MKTKLYLIAKLLGYFFVWLGKLKRKQRKKEREDAEQKLRDDPTAFFNDRYGMRNPDTGTKPEDTTSKASTGGGKDE